ncbi:cytochrome P450 [Georgenia sp. AZ-5]|uniref:cytochrome P450 n=1 Tax=Georgenia sp. AZ-5 TaxID=3367526 RepID=UPI0037551F27
MIESSVAPSIDISRVRKEVDNAALAREVLAGGEIARSEDFGGFWAVVSNAAVKKAAADAATFCSSGGASLPSVKLPIPALPLEADPPNHRELRKLLTPELRPERILAWEDAIRAAVDECIDAFIERGSADLSAELGGRVPPIIIAQVLGLPGEDVDKFVGWTTEMRSSLDRNDVEANKAATTALVGYIDERVRGAKGQDGTDLFHHITDSEVAGRPVEHLEAVGTVLTLIIAGQTTTVNGISSLLRLVSERPEIKQALQDDPSLIPAAIDEALRLEAPVQYMARTVTSDTVFGGVEMKAGDKVALLFGLANLDEAGFENPGKFDLGRRHNNHLAFGHGIHRCVGEHLARAEMRISLEQMLARVPDFRLDGDVQVGVGGHAPFNRGPLAVPVTFTPGKKVRA